MEMKNILCLLLWSPSLFLFALTSVGESNADPNFAEGQEWSIKSAPHSTIKAIIGRIEPWKNKIAVHVSIVDIPISQDLHSAHRPTHFRVISGGGGFEAISAS